MCLIQSRDWECNTATAVLLLPKLDWEIEKISTWVESCKKKRIFLYKNTTCLFNSHLLCASKSPLKSISVSIFPLKQRKLYKRLNRQNTAI